MHFDDAYDGYHDFHDNWFGNTMGDSVSAQDIFHDARGEIGVPDPNPPDIFYDAKESAYIEPRYRNPVPYPKVNLDGSPYLEPKPRRDMIMQTPNNISTPILMNTSMHSVAPPLSGYNQNNYTGRWSSIESSLSGHRNTTGDMGVANSWLSPGTPFVSHEYPSALFPTDSDARFVSRRKTRKFRNPSPIYSSDSSTSQSEIVPSRIKVINAPRNQPRRSSIATVQPSFNGMRASMSPMTPNNNYMQL